MSADMSRAQRLHSAMATPVSVMPRIPGIIPTWCSTGPLALPFSCGVMGQATIWRRYVDGTVALRWRDRAFWEHRGGTPPSGHCREALIWTLDSAALERKGTAGMKSAASGRIEEGRHLTFNDQSLAL